MRLVAVAVSVLALAAPAGGGYIITPVSGGLGSATVNPGDAIDLDIHLTSDAADEHTSAIFSLVFSKPGLVYEGYAWTAPYSNGTDDDDSKPLAGILPQTLDSDTLTGLGYPADTVDVELSNATNGGTVPPAGFGTGTVATVTLRVPADYSPVPDTITIGVDPDTLADGFNTVDTTPGPAFELTILPEPASIALLAVGGLAMALRCRSRTDRR